MSRTETETRPAGPAEPKDPTGRGSRHHRRRLAHDHPPGEPGRWADVLVEALMAVLLAFTPLAFGGVEAWSEQVFLGVSAAMTGVVLLKATLYRRTPLLWTWAYVPIALFLLWAALQVVPLPASILRLLTPHGVALRGELIGQSPDAVGTVSLYPLATRHDLRLLLGVVGVFFVVVNAYRRPEAIRRLLITITLIGAGVAALALAQDISGTLRVYWVGPLGRGRATAGPFIHYTHYGQFMNLSLGAAMGLMLVSLFRLFQRNGFSLAEFRERRHDRRLTPATLLMVLIVVGAVTVFLSGSRGAAISMAAAFGFATLSLSRNRTLPGKGWVMLPLVLIVFGSVLFVGFDVIANKMRTIHASEDFAQRWQILKDLTVVWQQFPAAGTGLGTHEVVYPMYDRSTIMATATHAENEYAQLIEETGFVGLALMLAFAAVVVRNYVRAARGGGRTIQLASIGLGFGLVAVLVNSLSDFGQHIPANAALTAVCCGLIVSLSRLHRPHDKDEPAMLSEPVRLHWALARGAGLALAAVLFTWGLGGANSSRKAEAAWAKAQAIDGRLAKTVGIGSNEDYAWLLIHAGAAAAAEPDNVAYAYQLNAYRWQSISRLRDPKNGAVITTPQTVQHTRRIVAELRRASELCPTYGPSYLLVGQLEDSILREREEGSRCIEVAYRLAPCNPDACFLAGRLDALRGNWDKAVIRFERYLRLVGNFGDVAGVFVNETARPDLAVHLAQGNLDRLTALATILERSGNNPALADQVRDHALILLRERGERPDAPADLLVRLAEETYKNRDLEGAIGYYKRALQLDYGQVEWRLKLARILAEADQVPDAMHQARVCLRLRQQMPAAKELLKELSVRPGATLDE